MTAVLTKSDINGSSLTIGYRDWKKDAAIRRFFVQAAAADTKSAVISAVYASVSTHHNELTNLPLQSLTATRIGIGNWLVIGRYDRSVTQGLPLTAPFLVDAATAFESMPIYTDYSNFEDGVPYGQVLTTPSLIREQKRSAVERKVWQRPVMRLKWPFETATHPMNDYRNAAGTTNAGGLAIGGSANVLPAQSVRYDGFVCDTYATTTGARYRGHHNLTYSPSSSWKSQNLFWDTDQWAVELVPMYKVGTWNLT